MDLGEKDIRVHISAGTIAKVILVILLFFVAYALRDIILVVITAVVIASSIEPAVKWFRRWKITRIPAVLIVYVGIALFLASIFYFMFLPLLSETSIFLSDLPKYVGTISLWNPLPDIGSSAPSIVSNFSSTFSLSNIITHVNEAIAGFSGGFVSTLSTIFGGLLGLVLIVVLSFYLAVQENGITLFLKTITPLRHRKYVINLWNRAELKIALWMQGQIVLGVVIAVLVFLGLTILGVRHALLLAVLSGTFEIIPVFGPILFAIPGIAIAFVDSGFTLALVVTGFYIIVQQFENHLIYPLVVRKVVGVSPIIVILALIIGAKLAGFLGIILSVPLATILVEFLNDLQKEMLTQEKNEVVNIK